MAKTQAEQLLEACKQKLTELRAELGGKTPPPDVNAALAFNRITMALTFLESRVKAADALLTFRQYIERLLSQLASLVMQLKGFLQNAGQWQALDTAIDNTLSTTNLLVCVPPELSAEAYMAALREFIAARDEAVKQAEGRAAKMEEKVGALVEVANKAIDKATDVERRMNAETTRLDKLVSETQARFNRLEQTLSESNRGAEALRDKAAAEAEAKRVADAKLAFDKLQEETKRRLDEQHKLAGAHVKEMEMRLEEAKKIVGLIANTGMAGHYQKTAGVEWWSMWILRLAAAACFVGATLAVAWLISLVHAQQIDWELVVFRFALVAVFLAPAFYFARESGRHMRREAHYRRIELELAAFRPFIESLPEATKQEIIKKKTDDFFGQEPPSEKDKHQILSETWFRGDQLAKLVIKILAAWRGK